MAYNYPHNIPVETPFGMMAMSVTDGDHIYLDGNHNGKSIVVNGVELGCSIHLNKIDGEWVIDPQYLYASRKGSLKPASDAARKKLLATIPAIIKEYMLKNPRLLTLARADKLDTLTVQLEAKITEKERELEILRAELLAVKREQEQRQDEPFVG